MTRSKDCKSFPLLQGSKSNTGRPSYPHSAELYLSNLRAATPSSTFQSQKQTLSMFSSWARRTHFQRFESIDLGTEFIKQLANSEDYAIDTICGHAHNLANYIGYCQQGDPEVITARIFHALGSEQADDRIQQIRNRLFGILNEETSPSGYTTSDIEELFQQISRTRYGSRSHAFIEIIRETYARPTLVRALNLEDFSPERSTIRIGIPDDSLLSEYGLVETRVANVGESLVEVVTEYIEHDRKGGSSTAPDPLFATTYGRVSASTIRRSLKSTSKAIPSTECIGPAQRTTSEVPSRNCNSILPSDIWWHSLSTITRDNR